MNLKYLQRKKDQILAEGELSDWPGYNTPAARKKDKELKWRKSQGMVGTRSLFSKAGGKGFFYDGMKLYDLLTTQSKIEYNNYIGEKIYSIEKDYELPDFDYREENTENMFGNKINVFMDSIGQELPEYLVNIEFVIAEMRKIGLELHTPKVKEEYSTIFQKYCLKEEGRGDFESILEILSNKNWKKPVTKNGKTDTDIIKKYYPRLTEMFRNEKLKQLSGLNNYLVFKKV